MDLKLMRRIDGKINKDVTSVCWSHAKRESKATGVDALIPFSDCVNDYLTSRFLIPESPPSEQPVQTEPSLPPA